MKTKQDYYELQAELGALAEQNGHWLALTDPCIDRENVLDATGVKETDDDFWARMYASMCSAAGQRGEDLGLNVNKLLGRIIY